MRSILASALFLALGCASAAPLRAPLTARVARVIPPPPAAAPISIEERTVRARREAAGEILAEHRGELDGEARLHLVLEQGSCYRAWVAADGPFAAELVDEHGHTVARGGGEPDLWLGDPLCPRWSGSFALVVEGGESPRALSVLLVRAL